MFSPPLDLQPSLCWFLLPLADSEAQSPTSHQPLQIFRHYSSRLLFPVFPSSGGERGRGYISAINILTDFSERQLGNKRPYTSSWLIGSFIHITGWYFCWLAFLDPLNDETTCVCIRVCVRAASSLFDSLKAQCPICKRADDSSPETEREEISMRRERESERHRQREGEMREKPADSQRQKVRMWGECANCCGISNGYYEGSVDWWNILIVWFSQLGVMDVTVKQLQSWTWMTDASLKAHSA